MIRLVSICLALLATGLPAQQGLVRLQPANARPSTEFSDLTSIRELGDGRVLVFDRKENWLAVVNLTDGSMNQISRYGRGPGEFEGTLALFSLGGDSTLAADLARRWLIVVADSVVTTLPPDNPGVRAVSLWPLGADKQGRVLSRAIRRGSGMNDSTLVLLIERATGRSDTIARLRSGVRRAPVSGGRGDRISRIPLDVWEASLLLPDGWTAVVRLDPYRVDWRSPDGAWTLGRPVPDRPIRMNASERKAYSDRYPGYRSATDWPELLPHSIHHDR